MSALFSEVRIGDLRLENRIVVAPMCQFSATSGLANDWHLLHLGSMALSGAGLLIIEATAVTPEGRITWADLGLWDDTTEEALARIIKTIRPYSRIPMGIQLGHAGRKASADPNVKGGVILPNDPNGWHTLAPSPLSVAEGIPAPKELDSAGIERIITAFGDAALRAARAGIDLIELHAAHGFLMHQFLSPLSNQRTDAYGGSLENRMRLTLQIFDAVKAAAGDRLATGIRISALVAER